MIKKWRNKMIIFLLIAALLTVIGAFMFTNIDGINDKMRRLKEEGTVVDVTMCELPGSTYSDGRKHKWGYDIPGLNLGEEGTFDGVAMTTYTLDEADAMHYILSVYYIYENGNLITDDKFYVDSFKPLPMGQCAFLWSLAAVCFAVALYYIIRNFMLYYVIKKGEESIGRFEEAIRPNFGSHKYYKIKYTFVRDGEEVTAYTAAIYTTREAEALKNYGSFPVRYIGKRSAVILKGFL